jgi:hypothetical protein
MYKSGSPRGVCHSFISCAVEYTMVCRQIRTLLWSFLMLAPVAARGVFDYVSPTGSHSPSFLSPATAATTIQVAVDGDVDGDTVLIAALNPADESITPTGN